MSTVPGNPALPAPLAPAMHPGDRDTHLDLDDLIDHSHEATQQASAGAQHPTRRWKRGVGRKSKTRKPRNPDAVMPLADHLVEFRKRFVRAIAGIIIMSIVGWMFSDQVFRILQQPFLTAAGQQQGLMSITFNGVVSAFNVKLEIAFFLGLTASCPWWSYQVWAFINPGLKRKERWTAVTFIGASVPLFLTGAGLAWYLLPQAVAILTGFAPANTATLLSADVYFDFILRMTVAFGLSFLLPVVMAALTMMNAVETRTWLKQWRLATVIAFIFAAVATPTGDPGTLCALALPIIAIYFAAIAVCAVYEHIQLWKVRRAAGEEPKLLKLLHKMRAALPFRAARKAKRTGKQEAPATITAEGE